MLVRVCGPVRTFDCAAEAVRHLLARGADAIIDNNKRETAARLAARNSHRAGFEALIALLEAAEPG